MKQDIKLALLDSPKSYFEPLKKYGVSPCFVDKSKAALIEEAKNANKINSYDFGKWLNRKLFTQEKEELTQELELRDSKRQLRKWPTVKSYLEQNGYQVIDNGSKAINPNNGKRQRYVIIKMTPKC